MDNTTEKDLISSLENEDWLEVSDVDSVISDLQKAAQNTAKKDYRINIRISSRDVSMLKSIAMEEGIPYQTLISSVLHKYVNGRYVDKKYLED